MLMNSEESVSVMADKFLNGRYDLT
jgi:hypothetical protein